MNKLQEFLGSVVTIHYKTLEGESVFESGRLLSVGERQGSTFFKLEYTDQTTQRASGISFSVKEYTVVEGEGEGVSA